VLHIAILLSDKGPELLDDLRKTLGKNWEKSYLGKS